MKTTRLLLIGLGLALAAPLVAQTGQPAAPPPPTVAPVATSAPLGATPAIPAKPDAAPGIAMVAPTPGIGQPVLGSIEIQPQVTPNGARALWMHNVLLMPIITLISLFVLGLLLWTMWRYRRSANPNPSRTSHNTLIEVIWTLVPVLILVAIAIPSISLLAAQYKPPGKDAVTVKAIGNQWYWTYEYPDNGGFEVVSNMLPDAQAKARGEPRLLAVDNRIVVPVGRTIRLLTTSNDVIHSWAVPAFWIKMDAVPGRTNEASFRVDKPGVYYGQCSELCGARHGFMPIAVQAVSAADFEAWVASKGGTMPGAKPAAAMPAATTAQPAGTPPATALVPATSTATGAANAAQTNSGTH